MATIAAPIAVILLILTRSTGSDTLLVEEQYFGTFERAHRIMIDPRGGIFVVDRGASTIHLFSSRFEHLAAFGGFGWSASSFDHPTAIATDGLTLFVSDYGNHRVSRFDQPLTAISLLSTRDTSFAPARFGFPEGVALSRQGDLYILDGENSRVLKFDRRSNFEMSFGGYEFGAGALTNPIEIIVSNSDRIYVLEPNRIVEFDYTGNYLGAIGQGILRDAAGFGKTKNGVAVISAERLWFFDETGTLSDTVSLSNVLSGPLKDLADIAIVNDRIFLLTHRSVGVFKVLSGPQ